MAVAVASKSLKLQQPLTRVQHRSNKYAVFLFVCSKLTHDFSQNDLHIFVG